MGSKRSHRLPARFLSIVALLCLAVTLGAATPASAQNAEEAEGSADIRSAPFVGNGSFRTEIVTGEVVWFRVQYTNDTDLSISARLDGVDADASEELELFRDFLGPNLDILRAQSEDIGPGYRASWSGGETDTNVWFVGFYLDTTEQLGVLYDLEFELSGFSSVDRDECGSDCPLDEDLDELEVQVADLEGQVEECGEECIERLDADELEAARAQAEGDIEAERAAVIDLCGGEEECDPLSSSTPWPLVVVLFIAAAVTVGGLVRTLTQKKPTAASASGDAPSSGTAPPDTPPTEAPA